MDPQVYVGVLPPQLATGHRILCGYGFDASWPPPYDPVLVSVSVQRVVGGG
jgi:hypothetical protein